MARRAFANSRLRPAERILLACAREELLPCHVDQIAVAARQVDWGQLVDSARAHGISYFLALHLTRLAGPTNEGQETLLPLPAGVRDQLRVEMRDAALRALALLEGQLRLAAAFDQLRLQILWLKGLALSEQLYGRIEARQATDLDILVGPAQMAQAEDVLRHHGFEPYLALDPADEDHPAGSHHRIWCGELIPNSPVSIELHYRLAGPPRAQPGLTELLQRSRVLDFKGQPMRVPSIEDELQILCLHAHQHNFAFLRLLMDVAEYVKRYRNEINWRAFFADAAHDHCKGRVTVALQLADAALGLELSPEQLQGLPRASSFERWVLQRMEMGLFDVQAERDRWRRTLLALLMDRWQDVFALVRPYVMPSNRHLEAGCSDHWGRYPGLLQLMHCARLVQKVFRRCPS